MFLNQAYASLWPAYAWFLEIAFIHTVHWYVCACPEGTNNQWHDIDHM